jgi:predicted TIM-barrel fold metal-dependent hydrolase
MQLIDVHAHFIPDHYRQALIAAGHTQPDGMPAIPAWSADGMLETMERIGIDTAILSVSSPGVHFGDDAAAAKLARSVNEEGTRQKAAHPERFGLFASLPLPDVDGALREIDFAFDQLNADGIVIESNSAGIYPGDALFDPVFAELDRRGAVLFLHPTSPHCPHCAIREGALPRPMLEFMFESTRAITNLVLSGTLEKYRNLKLIVPHAGATLPVLAERIAAFASVFPDLHEGTARSVPDTLAGLYYDVAGFPLPQLLPALRTLAPAQHLLYGSDWPFTPEPLVGRLLTQLDSYVVKQGASLNGIWRRNAEALFPRFSKVTKL